MISIRTLVLGSVAITSSGVQAADLPVAKAAPVEYVRICSTHGAGFFYVPGTETCLRVGGHVRAEYLYLEPSDRAGHDRIPGSLPHQPRRTHRDPLRLAAHLHPHGDDLDHGCLRLQFHEP